MACDKRYENKRKEKIVKAPNQGRVKVKQEVFSPIHTMIPEHEFACLECLSSKGKSNRARKQSDHREMKPLVHE